MANSWTSLAWFLFVSCVLCCVISAQQSTKSKRFSTRAFGYEELLHQKAIKQAFMKKVLEKLGMKNRPPPIPLDKRKPNLPRPLIDGGFTSTVEEEPNKKVDIVVSSEEGDEMYCRDKNGCFIFKINHNFLRNHKIEYAALHVHKEGATEEKSQNRMTIFLDEAKAHVVSKWGFKKGPNRQKRAAKETDKDDVYGSRNATRLPPGREATMLENEWFTVFINDMVDGWLQQPSGPSVKHRLHIAGANLNISTKVRYRPFIVLKLQEKARRRVRRSYGKECVPGYDKCCLRKLFIRFKDIDWHDWVIKPDGYQVNYCEGRCTGTGIMSARTHAFVKRDLLKKHPNLQICCVPLKFEPLTLLHYDDDGSILKSPLPNMSVLECGCV